MGDGTSSFILLLQSSAIDKEQDGILKNKYKSFNYVCLFIHITIAYSYLKRFFSFQKRMYTV